jgi:hypothetical protein
MTSSLAEVVDEAVAELSLPTLAVRINEGNREAQSSAFTALEKGKTVGDNLRAAKELCPHGTWMQWMKDNLDFSQPMAWRYMRISENWREIEANYSRVNNLSLHQALELLSEKPEEPEADGEDDGGFFCPDCHEKFSVEVVECRNCGHHYPPEDEECSNCHEQLVQPDNHKVFGVPVWFEDSPTDENVEIPQQPIPIREETATDEPKEMAHVGRNSGNNEWYTPPEYIEAARLTLGSIDLDPASSEIANRTVQARAFYSAEDDGLTKNWAGRVWLNPPYAVGLIDKFIEKLCLHFDSGHVTDAIVLVNNATETAWFQHIAQRASAICFPKRRVRFLDPEGNPGAPLQGQAVIYLGDAGAEFAENFAPFGFVL